jgi:hypothetical protein
MTWKLYYYDEVIQDIREAKKWYREQQKGLDTRFVADVKISIDPYKKIL